jgi:hypothetical protein
MTPFTALTLSPRPSHVATLPWGLRSLPATSATWGYLSAVASRLLGVAHPQCPPQVHWRFCCLPSMALAVFTCESILLALTDVVASDTPPRSPLFSPPSATSLSTPAPMTAASPARRPTAHDSHAFVPILPSAPSEEVPEAPAPSTPDRPSDPVPDDHFPLLMPLEYYCFRNRR